MKFDHIRIVQFSADFCGVCKGIDKTQVVERFVDANSPPRMSIVKLLCGDKDGAQSTPEYERNFKISDSYGVEGFPTFIIEGKRKDGSGFEIARVASDTVSAFTLKEFNRVFREGMEAIEELPDDVESQDEASKTIRW